MGNVVSESAGVTRSTWAARRLRALRAFSFPVSGLPVVAAVAAALPVAQWRWGLLVASVAGALLLHGAGNLFNDYFDYISGVDHRMEDDEGRPGRLLVRGELLPRDYLIEALTCFVLGAAIGAYVVWSVGTGVLVFAAAAAFGLYTYTGKPFSLKYRALGEPLIFFVFGPMLMLGSAYVQTGQWEWRVFALSVPIGFATTSIVLSNNLRDLDEDSAGGVTTLARVIGMRAATWLYFALTIGCPLGIAAYGAAGLGPRALMAAPLLLIPHLNTLVRVARGERIPNIDARQAQFETLILVFTIIVLAIGTK